MNTFVHNELSQYIYWKYCDILRDVTIVLEALKVGIGFLDGVCVVNDSEDEAIDRTSPFMVTQHHTVPG